MSDPINQTRERHRLPILLVSLCLTLAPVAGWATTTTPANTPAPQHQVDTHLAQQLLAASDKARGGGLPGISWQVDVETRHGNDSPEKLQVRVKSNGEDNLMEILLPLRQRGKKILMRGNNMWFSSPSVRKPVPISARQRLSGQAAYGDIAATHYVRDYTATLEGQEKYDGHDCDILTLAARSTGVTYDKVRYWIRRDTGLGVRAEFFTRSGKHVKTATFRYENIIGGTTDIPFISEMKIEDALASNTFTTLRYSDVTATAVGTRELRLD